MDTGYSVWRAKKNANKPESETAELRRLRAQLALLKSFPADFRDASIATPQWQAMLQAAAPEKRLAMETWASGPILYCHPLTQAEQTLSNGRQWIRYSGINSTFIAADASTHFEARLYELTLEDVDELMYNAGPEGMISDAKDIPISFIYGQSLPSHVIKALNTLLSWGQATYRFMSPFTTEKGITPGL